MLEGVAGVIVAVGTLLGAIGALFLTIRNGRTQSKAKEAAERAAEKAEETKQELAIIDGQIRQLGLAVDGRLTQLLEEVRKAAHAQGKAEGKTEEKHDERDRKNGPRGAATPPVDVKIVDTKGHVPVVVKEPKKD